MGTGRHFAEKHLIPFHEELDAKNTPPTENFGNSLGIPLGFPKSQVGHGVRLPGFTVISIYLNMTDRFAKGSPLGMPDSELGDLIVIKRRRRAR